MDGADLQLPRHGVGVIVHGQDDETKRAQYAADITYGTNNEFGFDYLRDNMKYRLEDMVQREFCFGIVDEVDSILIDEARTPLIISGPAEDSSDLYRRVNAVVAGAGEGPGDLRQGREIPHRVADRAGIGTRRGHAARGRHHHRGQPLRHLQRSVVHHVQQSLRAHTLFARDVDYIVREDQVIIIDEFTGRMMHGRRYSDGLHQALEAKEFVTVQAENQTMASITFQNYFRLYPKLAGMTGTAMTEADEFAEIYKLDVVEIPTNVACIRDDEDDEVYRTAAEKYEVGGDVDRGGRKRGQPVLVGTTSIEKSEVIHEMLKKKKVPHAVLNARFHEQEAEIVGAGGGVGGGDDRHQHGRPRYRHQTRRQPGDAAEEGAGRDRGRNPARRGRPRFARISLPRMKGEAGRRVVRDRHGAPREPAGGQSVARAVGAAGGSRALAFLPVAGRRPDAHLRLRPDGRDAAAAGAEGRRGDRPSVDQQGAGEGAEEVEARNFDTRKNVLKYDDVMNAQRKEVYAQRKEFMKASDVSETVAEMRAEVVGAMVSRRVPEKAFHEQWELAELQEDVRRVLNVALPVRGVGARGRHRRDAICASGSRMQRMR